MEQRKKIPSEMFVWVINNDPRGFCFSAKATDILACIRAALDALASYGEVWRIAIVWNDALSGKLTVSYCNGQVIPFTWNGKILV